MLKILITGSSGMIGSELMVQLAKDYQVTGLDIVEPEYHKYQTINHDLRLPIPDSISELALEKFDLIIHLAANARVHNLVKDPQLALDNILMTHNIFEFARKKEIPRILFASSRECYGNTARLPVNESAASQRHSESNYTASKIMGEAYCYAYNNCYKIDTKIARFSNVYGRFDFSDRFIPKAFARIKENRPFEIYGEGKNLSFTYLEDCVSGIMHLIKVWDSTAIGEKEFNISSDEQSHLLEVAHKIKVMLNSESVITVGENLVGEVVNYQADITKMRDLGWSPKVSIDEGLELAKKYYVA